MKLGCLTAKILNAACCLWSLLTVKLRKGTLTAPVSWIRTNLGGDCGGRWLWHQALSRGMWLMANKCWLLQTILRSYLLFAQKMVIRENELVTPGSNGIHLAIRVSPLEFLYNYTIWKTVWYEFKFMNSTAVSDVFISNVPRICRPRGQTEIRLEIAPGASSVSDKIGKPQRYWIYQKITYLLCKPSITLLFSLLTSQESALPAPTLEVDFSHTRDRKDFL